MVGDQAHRMPFESVLVNTTTSKPPGAAAVVSTAVVSYHQGAVNTTGAFSPTFGTTR